MLPIISGVGLKAFVEVKLNQTTSCVRYVHLGVETGNLTVNTWQCPAGYDWTAASANPATDCGQQADNKFISLQPGGTGKPNVYSGHSGDTGPGTITFTTMIPGPYLVFARSEPFGSNTDWHVLGACGSDPIAVVDWDFSPGSGWIPNAVITSGGTTVCNVYLVPPAPA